VPPPRPVPTSPPHRLRLRPSAGCSCNWHNRCDRHVLPHPGRRPPPPHHLSNTASLTGDRPWRSQRSSARTDFEGGLSTSAWGTAGGLRGQRRLPTIPPRNGKSLVLRERVAPYSEQTNLDFSSNRHRPA
jgi:hypothetical protein